MPVLDALAWAWERIYSHHEVLGDELVYGEQMYGGV